MIPSSSSFSRVIPIMPSKDASAQKANRERLKAEKEERRRLGGERANESRKKRRANPEHLIHFDPTPPRSALYLLTTNFFPLTVCT